MTEPSSKRTNRPRDDIDPEVLRTFLEYDEVTGDLTWKPRPVRNRTERTWHTRYAGKLAGSAKGTTYWEVHILGQTYVAHRVAWALYHGKWPDGEIDHVDGNGRNNAISNLRDVPRILNGRNRSRPVNNTSGVLGVSWHRTGKKWHARIIMLGKTIHLGLFDNIHDAANARRAAEAKYGFHPNHGRSA